MIRLLLLGMAAFVYAAQGLLVPFYHYPSFEDREVKKLASLQQRHKDISIVAIINPNNGEFTRLQHNFARTIAALHRSGVHVVGYLYSGYGKRPLESIEARIEEWKRIYGPFGIEGIFVDEVNATQEWYDYYAKVARMIRKNFEIVIFNPGVEPQPNYFDLADIVVVRESSHIQPCRYVPKSALLLHDQPELNLTHKKLLECYDYIYITEQKMPNPWAKLSRYLDELVGMMER